LDGLRAEFEKIKNNKNKLKIFHHKLSTLKFLDPACGSGNFLIIAYRELRLLEIDILRELYKSGEQLLDVSIVLNINVDQFYGIEYEEFASKIAEVAMWLIDHQMNMRISEEFGQYFVRLPLKKSASIINGNALRVNWENIVSKNELSYILGNPPFRGTAYQNEEQKDDLSIVFSGVNASGNLDYVSAWYLKASEFIQETKIEVCFVSTNSITQGEQANILWKELFLNKNIFINFAHRTFVWNNEAKRKAAVHVVIICFSKTNKKEKFLFDYINEKGNAEVRKVKKINQYLINASTIFLKKRTKPICNIPKIGVGSAFLDGGFLIMTNEQKQEILSIEPFLNPYIKRFLSSYEFINNIVKWCFWLENINPKIIRKSNILKERLLKVKEFREKSNRKKTKEMAQFPMIYGEERQPKNDYIIIPKVSSQRRKYIPIGFVSKENIITDKVFALQNGDLYSFGIITSKFHMLWVQNVGGRLKSDYSYSNTIVYNNYPWPKDPIEKNIKRVEEKSQMVLDVRAEFTDNSLADLYDPLTMPPKLVKAHQALDKAVDLCYRPQAFTTENARIEYLFDLYSEYTMPLLKKEKK